MSCFDKLSNEERKFYELNKSVLDNFCKNEFNNLPNVDNANNLYESIDGYTVQIVKSLYRCKAPLIVLMLYMTRNSSKAGFVINKRQCDLRKLDIKWKIN